MGTRNAMPAPGRWFVPVLGIIGVVALILGELAAGLVVLCCAALLWWFGRHVADAIERRQ
jgi:hypothetical protein